MPKEIGPGFRYGVGFEDGLQEAIDLATRLKESWRDNGHKELARACAIFVYLLTRRKADWIDGVGGARVPGGESGTGEEGAEARVDRRSSAGAVDESVLAMDDGSGGDISSGGPSREGPTPQERLERIREILNRGEKPDGFLLNGFATQYDSLADLYDEDFAVTLREAVEGLW